MPTLNDVEVNPLAEQFCAQHETRIEALAAILWPSVELDRPLGVEHDEGQPARTATDDESQALSFSILERFTITGDDRFEEQTADDLEEIARVLLELARRIRSELTPSVR